MTDDLLANVGSYVHASPWLAIAAVFAGGALTATNPCVLAKIPLMMGFVAGRREQGSGALRAFGYSLAFVAGLGVTFAALGVIAALAGTLYGETSAARMRTSSRCSPPATTSRTRVSRWRWTVLRELYPRAFLEAAVKRPEQA